MILQSHSHGCARSRAALRHCWRLRRGSRSPPRPISTPVRSEREADARRQRARAGAGAAAGRQDPRRRRRAHDAAGRPRRGGVPAEPERLARPDVRARRSRRLERDERRRPRAGAAAGRQGPRRRIHLERRDRLYRLNANGSPDQTFGQAGAAAIDSGGTSVSSRWRCSPTARSSSPARLDDDRQLRPCRLPAEPGRHARRRSARAERSASTAPRSEAASALALQPDGKVVVAGGTTVDDNTDAVVYRLNANGTLDDGFGGAGRFGIDEGGGRIRAALVRQPDGRILVAGYTSRPDSTADAFVVQAPADGTLDPGFGRAAGPHRRRPDQRRPTPRRCSRTGRSSSPGSHGRRQHRRGRLPAQPDGSRDLGFDADGARPHRQRRRELADALAVQQDGKIVVAGATISA